MYLITKQNKLLISQKFFRDRKTNSSASNYNSIINYDLISTKLFNVFCFIRL